MRPNQMLYVERPAETVYSQRETSRPLVPQMQSALTRLRSRKLRPCASRTLDEWW